MIRIFAVLFACSLLFGCGGSKGDPKESKQAGSPDKKKKITAKKTAGKKPPTRKKAAAKLKQEVAERLSQAFKSVNSKDTDKRDEALDRLDKESSLSEKIPAMLQSSDVEVRRGVMYYLITRIDPDDRQGLDSVLSAVSDKDRIVRSRALQLLREFRDAWVVPQLPRVAALLDANVESDAQNRSKVARLIGSKRQLAKDVLTQLAKAVTSDPSWRVRSACLVAAQQVGDAASTVDLFAKSLTSDKDRRVRRVAASRLKQIGRGEEKDLRQAAAKKAAPALVEALGDPDESVRGAAIEALVWVGRVAVQPLIEQLDAKDTTRRRWTILALGMIGKQAKAAKAPLKKLLTDKDPKIRKLVNAALKEIQ